MSEPAVAFSRVSIKITGVNREIVGPSANQTRIVVDVLAESPSDAVGPMRLPTAHLLDTEGRAYPPSGSEGLTGSIEPGYRARVSLAFVLDHGTEAECLIFAPGSDGERRFPIE